MTNNITINNKKNSIEITKAFEKAASRFGSDEYNMLRQAMNDNPNFKVIINKRKTAATSFKGLTYDFMENYIKAHDDDGSTMAEFNNLRATSDEAKAISAEAMSYGEIKAWFFQQYPVFAEFKKKREALLAA